MEVLVAVLIGILFACGIYSMLRRSIFKFIIGIVLISQAVNLLVFTASGLTRGITPIIASDAVLPAEGYADPLPQALVLTAIVIGFGIIAFCLALTYRAYQAVKSDDLEVFNQTEK